MVCRKTDGQPFGSSLIPSGSRFWMTLTANLVVYRKTDAPPLGPSLSPSGSLVLDDVDDKIGGPSQD